MSSEIGQVSADVIVVGSGMAGLAAAAAVAEAGGEPLVLSAVAAGTGSASTITRMAGAFVSVALGDDDSPQQHTDDTVTSGLGLASEPHVRLIAEEVADEIDRMEDQGVTFRRDARGGYLLFRSPGHTRDRTIAFGPGASDSITGVLAAAAKARGIRLHGETIVTGIHAGADGAAALSAWHARKREPVVVSGGAVVLATGGSGLAYPRSGIPAGVPGNAYALAHEAGCALVDMEFLQMYPTALAEPGQHHHLLQYDFLLELGAVLRNAAGDDVLAGLDLEPTAITRDQLCRVIGEQILAEQADEEGRLHFDVSACRSADEHPVLRNSPYMAIIGPRLGQPGGVVHVAPTAHTFLGGVAATPDGATGVAGLFACGEATGGVHGANRLQGNALAECAVIGRRAGQAATSHAAHARRDAPAHKAAADACRDLAHRLARGGGEAVHDVLADLQAVMGAKAGLVRSAESLAEADAALAELRSRAERASASNTRDERVLAVLPQLVDTARALVGSAAARTESRGAHFRADLTEKHPDGATYRTYLPPGQAGVTRLDGVAV